MLQSYLRLAIKVLFRRKVFTAISLFGIGFTLLVLTVAVAVLDHVFAPRPPEVRQDRTLLVVFIDMTGGRSHSRGPGGYALFDRYARGIPGVERLSIATLPWGAYSYPGGRRVKSYLRRTDADFWRILSFDFLEGAPFSDQDVEAASPVAVINETTRRRFFGDENAVGRDIEVDGQHFRVAGVVRDVPMLRIVPFADVWVPMTAAKSDAYRSQLRGECIALLLARDRSSFSAIQDEFRSRMTRVEFPDSRFDKIVAVPETFFASVSREFFGSRGDPESHPGRLTALLVTLALLFMLLPTLNLVNLNVSRILERAPEIGVRKAFGASSLTLVGQFIVENVVLTLVGGLLAFGASSFVLRALNASGLVPYAQFQLNPRIFVYGLVLAAVFGVLSGVYPAWRMSRLNPVQALKGATR